MTPFLFFFRSASACQLAPVPRSGSSRPGRPRLRRAAYLPLGASAARRLASIADQAIAAAASAVCSGLVWGTWFTSRAPRRRVSSERSRDDAGFEAVDAMIKASGGLNRPLSIQRETRTVLGFPGDFPGVTGLDLRIRAAFWGLECLGGRPPAALTAGSRRLWRIAWSKVPRRPPRRRPATDCRTAADSAARQLPAGREACIP